jgi:outer membrane protein assembly factor BamB
LLYFASSNCDTEAVDLTELPGPNMPPYDEALVALHYNTGQAAWKWRPREVDNDDLAFGAVPNLFEITLTINQVATTVDVVGIGNKDGTYYVVDRDGVNEVSGIAHNHASANTALPYWQTKVVDGGSFGGIIATASADQAKQRIYFTTAPQGLPPSITPPQYPNVHALDMNNGNVLWQNSTSLGSYGPTSSIPGVVFGASTFPGVIYAFDADNGARLFESAIIANNSIASGSVVVDGILMVGGGVGARHPNTGNFPDESTQNSNLANPLTALCVAGTPICQVQ